MSDLVKRLRFIQIDLGYPEVVALEAGRAADEIDYLRARLAEAERLLRILADGLDEHDDGTYSGELRTAICHAKERTRE